MHAGNKLKTMGYKVSLEGRLEEVVGIPVDNYSWWFNSYFYAWNKLLNKIALDILSIYFCPFKDIMVRDIKIIITTKQKRCEHSKLLSIIQNGETLWTVFSMP